MQNVAQSWLVYRLTHSELLLGTTSFCQTVPTLLLGPIAGVVADRFPRRLIVLTTQILFMLQAIILAVLTFGGKISVGLVMVLAATLGTIDAFDRPARQSMLIHLAHRDDLLSAISLNSVMFNLARIVGPSIGGLIVASFGEGVCFSLNAVSFLAVIGSLLLIRFPREETNTSMNPLSHLAEGLRYAARSARIWPVLGISGAVNIAVAPVFALLPFFSDAMFRMGSSGVGFLTAAMGLGAIVGTLGLASRKNSDGLTSVIFVNSIMLAFAMAAFAWAPTFSIAMAMMFALGYALMRQNASTNTELQTQADEIFRGRLMGLYATSVIGMLPVGSLAGGALAQQVGARWTVFAGSILCLATAVLFRTRIGETR